MTELNYGYPIQVGDKVKVGKGFHDVIKVTKEHSYVHINKRATLELPAIYSQEFKNSDEIDQTSYEVYRG